MVVPPSQYVALCPRGSVSDLSTLSTYTRFLLKAKPPHTNDGEENAGNKCEHVHYMTTTPRPNYLPTLTFPITTTLPGKLQSSFKTLFKYHRCEAFYDPRPPPSYSACKTALLGASVRHQHLHPLDHAHLRAGTRECFWTPKPWCSTQARKYLLTKLSFLTSQPGKVSPASPEDKTRQHVKSWLKGHPKRPNDKSSVDREIRLVHLAFPYKPSHDGK